MEYWSVCPFCKIEQKDREIEQLRNQVATRCAEIAENLECECIDQGDCSSHLIAAAIRKEFNIKG